MRALLCIALLALACATRPDTRPPPLTVHTVYEGRLPCDNCSIVLTRLTLEPDGRCLLQEEDRHSWDGDRRYEHRGHWRETRGLPAKPEATVYRLELEGEGGVRAFVVLQGGLRLQPLDEKGRPVEAVPPATLVRVEP